MGTGLFYCKRESSDLLEPFSVGGESADLTKNGDLTYLADQGVLLLNTSLTVRQSKAGSHAKIWREFTKLFLEKLNSEIVH